MDNEPTDGYIIIHSESGMTTCLKFACKYCGSPVDLTRTSGIQQYYDDRSNAVKPFIDGMVFTSDR